MESLSQAKSHYCDLYQSHQHQLTEKDSPTRQALRQRGYTAFEALSLPTRKDEPWKYSSVFELASQRPELATRAPEGNPIADLPDVFDGYIALFENGHFQPGLSTLPTGVTVRNLANHADYDHVIGTLATVQHSFDAMNLSFLQDGLVVHVPANTHLDKPLLILHQGSGSHYINLRHYYQLDENSSAEILELYRGTGATITNVTREIHLSQGAALTHTLCQAESESAFHIGHTASSLAKDATFTSSLFTLGAAWSRLSSNTVLTAPGAATTEHGLFLLNNKQHGAIDTAIQHQGSHTTANAVYHGIIDDKAHGVFNGSIKVHRDTRANLAALQNHNLLLSASASIDTKPELDIEADDVKCSHGATVGDLDPEALFYCQSRGIDKATATSLLLSAFANRILDAIQTAQVKSLIASLIEAKLTEGTSYE